MQNEKIYVGNGKEINTQYGPLLKLSFSAQELQQMLSMVNEKGYINLNVNRRQQPSQYGHTHSIVVDTWKPQQQAPQAVTQQYIQQNPQQFNNTQNMGNQPQYQQPPALNKINKEITGKLFLSEKLGYSKITRWC
jgi:hypothetical protein